MVFDKKKQGSAEYVGFPAWFSDVKNIESRLLAYAPAHVDVENFDEHFAGRAYHRFIQVTADDGAFFVRESGVKVEIRLAVLAAEIAV